MKKGIEANSEIIIRAKNVLGKALGTKTGSKPPDSVADCANAVVKSCLCDSSVLSVAGVEYKLGTKSMRMEDGRLKIGDFACECERYEQAFCRPAAKKKYVYVDAFECVDVSEDEIHVPVSEPFDPQCVTVVLSWRSDKFYNAVAPNFEEDDVFLEGIRYGGVFYPCGSARLDPGSWLPCLVSCDLWSRAFVVGHDDINQLEWDDINLPGEEDPKGW